jgi:hypothetical protein
LNLLLVVIAAFFVVAVPVLIVTYLFMAVALCREPLLCAHRSGRGAGLDRRGPDRLTPPWFDEADPPAISTEGSRVFSRPSARPTAVGGRPGDERRRGLDGSPIGSLTGPTPTGIGPTDVSDPRRDIGYGWIPWDAPTGITRASRADPEAYQVAIPIGGIRRRTLASPRLRAYALTLHI